MPIRKVKLLSIGTSLAAFVAMTDLGCGAGGYSKGATAPPPPSGHRVVRPAKWALAWVDDFNSTTIDPANWIVQNGAANVNSELEYYTPSDVYVENGALVLKSERRSLGGRAYTSGEVKSGTSRTVQQGNAIEWRTKAPSGKGIWPANWLVNTPCDLLNPCPEWPPEIDVFEMRGSAPTVNLMTHWWGQYPNAGHETSEYIAPASLADGYHTYRLEWFPDSVVWYVDGVKEANHSQNVTSGQLQIVMNTAVGGQFDGNPDGTTVFPQYHRIDFVRVFRDTANVY